MGSLLSSAVGERGRLLVGASTFLVGVVFAARILRNRDSRRSTERVPTIAGLPEGTVVAVFRRDPDASGNGDVFLRRRAAPDEDVPVDYLGLEGSVEWHRQEPSLSEAAMRERALLVQCVAHRETIIAAGLELQVPLSDTSFVPGAWGENVLVDGPLFSAALLCIGDQLVAMRGGAPTGLRLELASPRRPCSRVDTQHGQTYGGGGVRAFAARTGTAGLMFRVLSEGRICTGDTLAIVARPHPAWTAARVAALLYGDPRAAAEYSRRGVRRDEWCGSAAELAELTSVRELAMTEWRDQLLGMAGGGGEGGQLLSR